jgi:hypothetical protein
MLPVFQRQIELKVKRLLTAGVTLAFTDIVIVFEFAVLVVRQPPLLL